MDKIPAVKHGEVAYEIEVDEDMFEELSQIVWYASPNRHGGKYARRRVKDTTGKWRTQALHHFVLGLPLTHKLCVDHIDRNTLNCRKSNLRIVTPQQSAWNRGKTKLPTDSKYIGVHKDHCGSWVASISSKYLGAFTSEEAAAKAYDYAARRLRGTFAVLNFPDVDEKPPVEVKSASGRKYISIKSRRGRPQYIAQITCANPKIWTAFPTQQEAIEFRNQKLKELGVPIPD